MADEDGWVDGFPVESDHFAAWKGDRVPPPHHQKWDEALQVAVDRATDDWREGQTGEFGLSFRVRVSKHNPGWVDGYKVDLGG